MFLHQKFNWAYTHLSTKEQVDEMLDLYNRTRPEVFGFDTETTGLHHMTGVPFLMSFGWMKNVYTFDMADKKMTEYILSSFTLSPYFFAHNAKYDYHMCLNYGLEAADINHLKWADSITVARLTNYADGEVSMSLEELGKKFVDPDAKFGAEIIKQRLSTLNREWKRTAMQLGIDFVPANYQDVYKVAPNLMLNYAADDIVIMLEYLAKALPVLDTVDPTHQVFQRERELIPVVAEMERVGLRIDFEYAAQSRERMLIYKDRLTAKLVEACKWPTTFTANQHDLIKRIFRDRFGIVLFSSDEKNLKRIIQSDAKEDAKQAAKAIIELRTVDKWVSTYIDGKVSTAVNGRTYTSINNSGTVSGRVSGDMQQQPKEALSDYEGKTIYWDDGTQLFHPRRMYIADEGCSLFFGDYSQMELRYQAWYTIQIMGGDTNLCRAYIPFKCTSIMTGEAYDPANPEHKARWNSGEWVKIEDGLPWEEIDVHCMTTHKAFPHIEVASLSNNELNSKEFKKYRKLGKIANFLENYQGGVKALMEQLDCTKAMAELLHKAYREAFTGVKDYQKWVGSQYKQYRYTQNLYGRRYYMRDINNAYKAANYLIQGGCADLLKKKEIEIAKLISGTGVKMVLPIHDELVFSVPKGAEHIVLKIKEVLQDVPEIAEIPMLSEIEYSETNWADKGPWEVHE